MRRLLCWVGWHRWDEQVMLYGARPVLWCNCCGAVRGVRLP